MVEYLCELRESVLEAYTGIIQGLKGSGGEVSLTIWPITKMYNAFA